MNILIVEDNPSALKFIEMLLSKNKSYTIYKAVNGLEALDVLNANKINVVITDWMMPEMNGIELCHKIREMQTENYIYIIFVTAMDQKKDSLKGLDAGADDFLTKPIQPNDLKARLNSSKRILDLERKYSMASNQLLQAEKMASIGQLAAGVAHEINNPIGFVSSNIKTLSGYQEDIRELIKSYREFIDALIHKKPNLKDFLVNIKKMEKKIDIDYILEDTIDLVGDCQEGTERVKKIVSDLKDFAHPGEEKMQEADINKCITSTLNVIKNETKYKAEVKTKLEKLPFITCYPQQLNQVFMNIVVNAAQAIEKFGEINITSSTLDDKIKVTISDNGSGIKPENIPKIFDPFFTTKDVGKGTGLGMNVVYNIIKKHSGNINVESELGKGTTFTILLPVKQNMEENGVENDD